MADEPVRTLSGKAVSELSLDGVVNKTLGLDDFRISPDTLIMQARKAEAAGYDALGMNLRRAAEITAIPNHEVEKIYAQLRPGRSDYAGLMALAIHLESTYRAPLTAALVKEAAQVYRQRNLVPAGDTGK